MNAIDLIQQQHREVEDLFQEIEEAGAGEQQELFNRIADSLAVHCRIEEDIFYPECRRAEVEELLRESLEEHLGVKRILADLLEMEPGDPQWAAKCHELKEQVEHHVQLEESDLLPRARRLLGARRLDEMGDVMEQLVAQLEEQGEPRNQVPAETEAAAPL